MSFVRYHTRINNQIATKQGASQVSLRQQDIATPEDFYRLLDRNYPKFFKMDLLCKWAWLGAEWLLKTDEGFVYEGMDKNRIAVVLFTRDGCLEVDKRYQDTLQTIPSPALFVYTLPNIMLGEICIRHGFKGEQLCMVADTQDEQEMMFWVNELLQHKGMDACLCGWADATAAAGKDISMYWITRR